MAWQKLVTDSGSLEPRHCGGKVLHSSGFHSSWQGRHGRGVITLVNDFGGKNNRTMTCRRLSKVHGVAHCPESTWLEAGLLCILGR